MPRSAVAAASLASVGPPTGSNTTWAPFPPGHRKGRHGCRVAVDPVAVLRKCRDRANGVADLEPFDPFADGRDGPGRLVADARGELGLLQVVARTEHRLGPVEAQRFHRDAN